MPNENACLRSPDTATAPGLAITLGPEDQMLAAIRRWWDATAPEQWAAPPELLTHIPNERAVSHYDRMAQREKGLRAGMEDLFLAVPTTRGAGLFIEIKRPIQQSRQSTAQQRIQRIHGQWGYLSVVCRTVDDAIRTIIWWMSQRIETATADDDLIRCWRPFGP